MRMRGLPYTATAEQVVIYTKISCHFVFHAKGP